MSALSKIVGSAVLVALPITAVVLWIVSGGERLTKAGKVIPVTVRDELFGGNNVEQRIVPGPIFGYYVGLDIVIAVTGAVLVVAVVWRLLARRKYRLARQVLGGSNEI